MKTTKKKATSKAKSTPEPARGRGRPRRYSEPPPPKRGLFAARSLSFDPPLPEGQGRTRDRELVRALRKWRDGKSPRLVVTHNGATITADQVDWDTLPKLASASGTSRSVPTGRITITLKPELGELLSSAAAKLRTGTMAETVEAALRLAITAAP